MNQHLSKLANSSALKEWQRHCAEAVKARDAYKAYHSPVFDHADETAKAKFAFEQTPSAETMQRWIALEVQRPAMTYLARELLAMSAARYEEALRHGGREKLQALISEAEDVLDQREKQIKADDQKRSENLNIAVNSEDAFTKIKEMRDDLFQARAVAGSRFDDAVSLVQGVIGY